MFCLFEICSPGWSQTPFAAQEDWELTPPDFTTQVLGLQVTTPVAPSILISYFLSVPTSFRLSPRGSDVPCHNPLLHPFSSCRPSLFLRLVSNFRIGYSVTFRVWPLRLLFTVEASPSLVQVLATAAAGSAVPWPCGDRAAPSLCPSPLVYIKRYMHILFISAWGQEGQTLGPLCSDCPLPACSAGAPLPSSLPPAPLTAPAPQHKGSCGACQLPLPEV